MSAFAQQHYSFLSHVISIISEVVAWDLVRRLKDVEFIIAFCPRLKHVFESHPEISRQLRGSSEPIIRDFCVDIQKSAKIQWKLLGL